MKLALILIAFVAPAQAQTPSQPAQNPPAAAGSTAPPATEDPGAARRLFHQLDRNGDGYLTSDELWAMRGREDNWAAVDRNRDGRISPDEFTVVTPRGRRSP